MNKNFEDVLYSNPKNRILRFSEYRKGSSEYGQLFQDLKMLLLLKHDNDTEKLSKDDIILTKNDTKNLDIEKLRKLEKDPKTRKSIGMSFDFEFMNNGDIRFYNLDNVDKKTRPWENFIAEKKKK